MYKLYGFKAYTATSSLNVAFIVLYVYEQEENILGQLAEVVRTGYFEVNAVKEPPSLSFSFTSTCGEQSLWSPEKIDDFVRSLKFYKEGDEENTMSFHHSLEVCMINNLCV